MAAFGRSPGSSESSPTDPEAVVRRFVEAFSAGDQDTVAGLVAADIAAHITNAAGEVDTVVGHEAFAGRLSDPASADEASVRLTQIVTVAPAQVLAMVEVRAKRLGRELSNHAAFLIRVEAGTIAELWMVEALPAYSAEFWA